ncbi:MAG: prolyl oligopeptidase family serine peptidase [Luminiphilus sp.]|nr:prolyl oligopeptidase family serine peptidase [Luminiphilus sp.]
MSEFLLYIIEVACLLIAVALMGCSRPQDTMKLEAIVPTKEINSLGMAGDQPADISRYLMANGASGAQISPDGDQVVYRSSITGTSQLWSISSDGGEPRQMTFGQGITFFRWLPNSSGLVYGADNNGNEQETYFTIDRYAATERTIFPATDGGFRVLGDIADDNKTFYFSSTERTGLHYDVYEASLETGDARLIYEGRYGNFARALSPDNRYLVVTETVGEDSDYLYLLDLSSGTLSVVSQPESRANHGDGGFAWSSDSKTLYLTSNLDREFAAVMAYDVTASRFVSVAESAFDLSSVNLCGPADRYLMWLENQNGFDVLRGRDLSSGEALEFPDIPDGVYTLTCSDQSDLVSVGISGWRTPGDIYLMELGSGAVRRLISSNLAGIAAESLVKPVSVTMPARDGVDLQGLLYLPLQRPQSVAPPVIFEVHGGPTAQARANFDAVSQYHVARGVAVFKPNVRGSTGFGRTYVTLDDQRKRLDSVRDLVDMLAFFESDGRVDASRAAVSGGSYGGYMVNAVLAAHPSAFKVGVSRYGVADWVTALEVASPALQASDRLEYGDIRESQWREFYSANSPIHQADNIRVPVLYSHGEMDPRINIYETEVMVKTLRANGVEAPYIKIPDEGHGWRKRSNRLFYYRRQADFIESHLLKRADD